VVAGACLGGKWEAESEGRLGRGTRAPLYRRVGGGGLCLLRLLVVSTRGACGGRGMRCSRRGVRRGY
jgi:hypothetical protein